MHNNIKKDLHFFNELVNDFINDEMANPVSTAIPANKLNTHFDLELKSTPAVAEEFKKELKNLVLNTPKSSSKLFFNQLFGGRHSKAILGDLLAVMLNNSMATYKIAGPQVAVEKEIINQINTIIGYPKGCGGTFPTGGSMANFMSLVMARDKKDATIKNNGMRGKLLAYTSANSHYSIAKNAAFTGIGRENVRYIQSDNLGKIDVVAFESQVEKDIENGFIPFYINATAGTTVLCAFDSVIELAAICKKHNIWLHLDGAFGGSVIFSEKYRKLVAGIELTDSFCFNAHKTLGAPLSTSVLVVKDNRDLYNSFNNDASYLYQTDDENYNLGQTSFECGRRNNALKLWCLWKAVGTNGIENIVNHEFYLADVAREYVRNNPDYTLYSFDDSLSICFNYKGFEPEALCTKLYESNKLMVGFGHFQNDKFIRLVTINGENSKEDILHFFSVLEEFAADN
ncbi:MAG: aminotransferase class V-fold PLP-dependent enzyme [Flavobacteriales bacterium]|jgi:sulfinoalanine decarboxylase|nr:aminotransferase class V-fold PLP-dependent enzyme [Flavobacteriales bacterium]